MTLEQYLEKLNTRYKTGISREHSYRGDLQTLLESIVTGVLVTNEPSRIACGAPDYIITKKNIPVGYIEAKDIGADLKHKDYKEQFERYRASLNNLIITNYLGFDLYLDGKFTTSVKVGEIKNKKVLSLSENFSAFENLIKDFCERKGQTIKSSKKLAEMMAGKARMLANVIETAIKEDEQSEENSTLKEQIKAFKDILIHDITAKEFSDIYAQTVAYGMFAARLHDRTLENFTRQEAAELIPKSNPFLRKLFGYIAGPDIDERIFWIVDALAEIFSATDVAALLKNFGNATQQNDPMIHFYETFLAEYDPRLRKARGVWYTPEPIVNFIVRAVDDILKTEFGLDGLADRTKIKIKVKEPDRIVTQEVHKVQILDPAAGTGTFLAEVIKLIYKGFKGQEGVWSNYVEEHLVPRLNGFELLMASYAMAHLKMDLLLTETGYKPKKQNRLHVYLTNSLEEYHPDTGTFWASWLSTEANEANYIKRDTPVMVVMGNPPYSVSSTNKSIDSDGEKTWIGKLTDDYKKDLNEKSYNSLSDDYVKFIRFGQHFISKNGEGILAYISNNSFIDGVTHRQMRKHLLETFDKIYILDLHGNSKKLETAIDGSKDENVFDIQQGVSINIFVKTNEKKKRKLAEVNHFDLFGLREEKYKALFENSIKKVKWNNLDYKEPYYFFIPKDFSSQNIYAKGIKIDDLFFIKAAGIKTHRDNVVIGFHRSELKQQIEKFLVTDNNSNTEYLTNKIKAITYRPFDNRLIYYDTNLVVRHRQEQMRHSFYDNYSLLLGRQTKNKGVNHFFISQGLSEMKTAESSTGSYHFALYLYPQNSAQQTLDGKHERTPNLNKEIVEKIAKILGLEFTSEKTSKDNTFAPIDILDYIYAVLHSPSYREKYKEFLKIDFPRVPYPKDAKTFWHLVKLGGELRQIHLLESEFVNKPITKFPVDGDNKVGKVKFENNKVWINDIQYFDKVPQVAWEFYIGGYQPAQKWLKDRKDRELSYDDIVHYQKIIVALTETDRLMKEIDKVSIIK